MNLTEATDRTCQEPTLLDALTWIAIWENDRSVRQFRSSGNGSYETCFRVSFQSVMNKWNEKNNE